MAMREIRTVGDPVLRTPCDPITTIDDRVRGLVDDLLETVDTEGRAGLAAEPDRRQPAGVLLEHRRRGRLRPQPRDRRAVRGRVPGRRRGLPVGPGPLVPDARGPGTRASSAPTSTARRSSSRATELMARCLQHEVDHLDGMLYLDRLERSVRKKAMRAIRDTL